MRGRLRAWWREKYRLPGNHPLFVERHTNDLLIEYHECLTVQRESGLGPEEGSTVDWGEHALTGDPVVDQWESQIHRGDTPDLAEGVTYGTD